MKTMLKLALGTVATACSLGSALAADFTMRLSHQFPPAHHVAKALDQFGADVKANTSGKVEVQIFGSESLFKATQNHAAVARGVIESAAILSIQWGATIPEMNVVTIPFLLTQADKLHKFPTSEAAKILNAKMDGKGVKNIGWLVDANDAIFTSNKVPLVKPEDFKGVKIRGLSKLFDNGLAAMNASPSAMPGSEVYQALQTGVIDGSITGVAAAYARRYYEVQKFGVAGPVLTVYANVIVSPDWWSKLPADARSGIEAAMQKAASALLPDSDDVAPQDIQNLRDKGMNVTVLTPEQNEIFRRVMQPAVIEAFAKSAADGARLVELINKL